MPKSGFRITQWNAGKIQKEVEDRAIKAIDKKLSAVVIDAKKNHREWQNVTGTAEGSVKVQEWARKRGNLIIGSWGSVGVDYVLGLELYKGSFLRRAAARIYGHGKKIKLF